MTFLTIDGDSTPPTDTDGSVGVIDPGLFPDKEILFKRRVRMVQSLREVWVARELIRSLTERMLRARYKQAILGFLWAIITPLVLMVAFTVVFDRLADIKTHGVPYALFSYMGLLPWTLFSASLESGMNSIIGNISLINKIHCPREVFPLAGVVVAIIDTLLSLLALVALFLVTGFAPKAESVWVPVIVPVLLLFAVGWAMLISVIVVYVRDLRSALPLMLQFGIFITPVAYGFDIVPKALRGVYSFVNPMGPVIDSIRRTVLFGQAPDLSQLALGLAGAMSWFAVGYWLFKRMETGIADVA